MVWNFVDTVSLFSAICGLISAICAIVTVLDLFNFMDSPPISFKKLFFSAITKIRIKIQKPKLLFVISRVIFRNFEREKRSNMNKIPIAFLLKKSYLEFFRGISVSCFPPAITVK